MAWLQSQERAARLWGVTVGRTSWSSVGPYEEATGAGGGQTTLGHTLFAAINEYLIRLLPLAVENDLPVNGMRSHSLP